MDLTIGGLTIAPLAIIAFIAAALINLTFAFGVSSDAKHVKKTRPLWFVWRPIWFIAVLLGGVPMAAIYWAMHHSTLAISKGTPE